MRVKIKLMYNGKDFCGYQIQQNLRTVQGELEKVLEIIFKEPVKTFASGRTDAGVSARAQVVHFDIKEKMEMKRLLSAINALLPEDVAATSAEIVPDSFDARFSVKKKTYRYYFYVSKFTLPLFCWAARINDYSDLDAMSEACKYFIGTHNFKSFVTTRTDKTDFVRTIYDAKIIEVASGLYAFEVTGNGFLYNMVRIIFGTLVSVAYHNLKPDDIAKIIKKRDRAAAGKTYAASPLVLYSVEYDENPTKK